MPPKKRARLSQAASPEPEPQAKTPTPAAASPDEAALNNPWTDDEEIGLFKGLMRWKPTGIHKHFRLLSLHAWLLENNYIHPRNEHTKPAGIWQKLNELYDLPALDAREDARQLSPMKTDADEEEDEEEKEQTLDDDVYSVAANKIESEDFELPLDKFIGDEMWKRRLPEKQDEANDLELPDINMAEEPPIHFTPSFSIEPDEAATPSKSTKSKKGKPSKGTGAAATRRNARKTESVADKEEGNEDEEEEDDEQEEDNEEQGEEDEEGSEDEEEESQASTPGPRGRRASKATTRSKTSNKSKPRTRARR